MNQTTVAALTAFLLLAPAPNAQGSGKAPAKSGSAAKVAVPAVDSAESAPRTIDHSVFDALLKQHVSNGLVDYAAFRNNPQFASYLASLNTADLEGLEEGERMAFWLNVYNAYTINLVASRGETESIRNIDKMFGVLRLKGPWSTPFVKAAGRTLTLDDVEHRILRHDFSDPRVHFAICVAAIGSPNLRNEAYTGDKLEDQLESQAREFILNSPKKNHVDTAKRTLYASPILTRYRSDFGASSGALGKFLAYYYPEGPERRMLRPNIVRARGPQSGSTLTDTSKGRTMKLDSNVRAYSRFRVSETTFDWALNIKKKP